MGIALKFRAIQRNKRDQLLDKEKIVLVLVVLLGFNLFRQLSTRQCVRIWILQTNFAMQRRLITG